MTSSILFLVPARAGSRRVPNKNLRHVAGIPLVAHAVRVARLASAALGPTRRCAVVCSTDDAEIGAVAAAWGADRILARPAALATDAASSLDVAIHAIDALGAEGDRFDVLVLLQPTSPLRRPEDVVTAVEQVLAGAGSVTTVAPGHPADFHVASNTDETVARITALDAGRVLTGGVYAVEPDHLRAANAFVGPQTRGLLVAADDAIDVDEEIDLVLAEAALAARPIRTVPLGRATIGEARPFVIAEIGVNHNGDPDLAHRLVDAVADAGADAAKFQTFEPAALAAAAAPTAAYQQAAGEQGDQRAMLERLALPPEAWAGLQAHAADRGIEFLSTPFDDPSADLLDDLGVPAFKVGSGELTNLPFLASLARRGRPLLVSTGMATMVEVAAAVDCVAAAGDPPLALLHCVSSYPASVEDANLRAIETMRRAFAVPVGWSDHTAGIELPVAAVAVGAAVIEKHVTLDRTMPGPDHLASLEPDELTGMVRAIRAASLALGSGRKEPVPAEAGVARVARRSLHWRHALPAGREIAAGDLAALRPATGLPPAAAGSLVGRRTARQVAAGSLVVADDLEP